MANWRPGIVFVGMETSGALRRRFQAAGFETYSCDTLPSEDNGEHCDVFSDDGFPLGGHIVGDVFETLDNLWAGDLGPSLGIFHPTCTYLTNSASWAYPDPDYDRFPHVGYHQRVKPGTLTGTARRAAREQALADVRKIMALPIARKVIENPVGAIGSNILRASQIIQPYEFGADASKATCLWYLGKNNEPMPDMILPKDSVNRVPGRWVRDRVTSKLVERWANQSDGGQNKLTPGENRWKERSRTYGGVADAMVRAWAPLVSPVTISAKDYPTAPPPQR